MKRGYLTGIFHADHEAGTESYIWKLSDGEFHEEAKHDKL